MATVLGDFTTEERRPVLRFLWGKPPMQNLVMKKDFLFKMRSVIRVKRLTSGSRNVAKVLLMT
jgi:hypothetical protein